MADNWLTKQNAHGFSLGDALYAWGGMLKGDSDPVGDMSKRMDARKEEAAINDLVAGLFGGGAQPAPALAVGQGDDTLAGGTGGPRPTGWSVMDGPKALTGAGVGGAGNPGEMGGMTPEMRQRLAGYYSRTKDIGGLLKLWQMDQQAQTPTYQQGPDGWYKFMRGLDPVRVAEFATKERPTPEGMVRDATGKLVLEDGYLDAVGQLGERRRQVVVDNPTPVRARAGGGGGGGSAPKRTAQEMTPAELLAIARGK